MFNINTNLIKYQKFSPKISAKNSLSVSSKIIGNTIIESNTILKDNVVLRGDGECILVGKNCILNSRTTIHVASDFIGSQIGDDCIIEEYSVIHACSLGNNVLVGANSIIMDGSIIGSNTIIMPDSLIPPGKKFKENSLLAGSPAKLIKNIDESYIENISRNYFLNLKSSILKSKNSYFDYLSDMKTCYEKNTHNKENVFIAPDLKSNCKLTLEKNSSVWFSVVISSERKNTEVILGTGSNIQDNCIFNTRGKSVTIGNRVTIGHNVIIDGGILVKDDVVIGMGATIEDGCILNKGAFIAANSYVKKNTVVPSGKIFAGRPAKYFRDVSLEEKAYFSQGQKIYETLSKNYLEIYKN